MGEDVKKLINVFFIAMMNLFVVFAQDSVAIEKDCELLKTYLQDVSIDCSLAVDEGLVDLDDVIQKIKDDYNSRKKKSKANNKRIYQEEFAKSIQNVLSKELPYKNGHMSVWVLDYYEKVKEAKEKLQNLVDSLNVYNDDADFDINIYDNCGGYYTTDFDD